MSLLVDTSVWIEYFRTGGLSENLDVFIDKNLIVTNDLILAELIPFLKVHRKEKTINLLLNIQKLDLAIDWNQIIEFQFKCLKNGLNGIGIPNFIVAQNAIQNHCEIYSLDNHFRLMQEILGLQLIG